MHFFALFIRKYVEDTVSTHKWHMIQLNIYSSFNCFNAQNPKNIQARQMKNRFPMQLVMYEASCTM